MIDLPYGFMISSSNFLRLILTSLLFVLIKTLNLIAAVNSKLSLMAFMYLMAIFLYK